MIAATKLYIYMDLPVTPLLKQNSLGSAFTLSGVLNFFCVLCCQDVAIDTKTKDK